MRVLLLATTTGYQTRAFGEAAERLGVELVFATDRCSVLDDPWQDNALAVRFHEEAASIETIRAAAPFDGVLAVGDRPAVLAAAASEALGLKWHPFDGALVARNKRLTRERLQAAGLPVPWFAAIDMCGDASALPASIRFPCVIKPTGLSGSRGVMRADDRASLEEAYERLRRLLQSPDVRSERSDIHQTALIEGFIEGREVALEGLMTGGRLQTLAIFDKPDRLDGPFFEETIYVTPTSESIQIQEAIADAVARAAAAIGLHHGPVHAECRVNTQGVFVLEVAARPIGGLCARALRFVRAGRGEASLEELLLRHALGERAGGWTREPRAAGVMMIPIPRRGVFRDVRGVDEARRVPGVEDVRITAKTDQALVPLPEGASYLGFIFARSEAPAATVAALRAAHERLAFVVDPDVRVVQSAHG